MIFDQILTKSEQIFTIYVNNHEIHVKKNQKCHFLKIKKIQRQKSPRIWGIGVWGEEIGVFGGKIN